MKVVNLHYPHKDLVPSIVRQRCIVEAAGCKQDIDDMNSIHHFLEHLCLVLNMVPMSAPMVLRVPILRQHGNNPDDYGVSAVQIWMESGVTMHTWPELGFIDINVETCKPFNPAKIGELVNAFFDATDVQITNIQTS